MKLNRVDFMIMKKGELEIIDSKVSFFGVDTGSDFSLGSCDGSFQTCFYFGGNQGCARIVAQVLVHAEFAGVPPRYGGRRNAVFQRSGTENVPAIAGLGVAAERIYTDFDECGF